MRTIAGCAGADVSTNTNTSNRAWMLSTTPIESFDYLVLLLIPAFRNFCPRSSHFNHCSGKLASEKAIDITSNKLENKSIMKEVD
ncbi:hypothetical protein ACO0LE_19510 [Undibacterium sp. Xuan67W]